MEFQARFPTNEIDGGITKKLRLAFKAILLDYLVDLLGEFIINSKVDSFHTISSLKYYVPEYT